jgi:hypothetical protein
VERARQVHRDDVVPHLLRRFGEAHRALDAGVVDHDVWPTPGGDSGHHSIDRGRIAHIGIEEMRVRRTALLHRLDGGRCFLLRGQPMHSDPRARRR